MLFDQFDGLAGYKLATVLERKRKHAHAQVWLMKDGCMLENLAGQICPLDDSW